MVRTTIKFNGARIAYLPGQVMKSYQMYNLGTIALYALKERVRSGYDVNDVRFPALSQKRSAVIVKGKFVRQRVSYAEWKIAHGLQGIRDLWGAGKDGGHMLDNLTVRSADENRCVMALTTQKNRAKALANELRTPWCGFSPKDQAVILAAAVKMWGENVRAIARTLGAKVRRAA